jgi:hypothetical protein
MKVQIARQETARSGLSEWLRRMAVPRPLRPLVCRAAQIGYAVHTGHWLEMPLNGRFRLRRMRTPRPKAVNAG